MNAAKVLDDLKRRFPNEPEYHQAVEEVLSTIEEEYNKHGIISLSVSFLPCIDFTVYVMFFSLRYFSTSSN